MGNRAVFQLNLENVLFCVFLAFIYGVRDLIRLAESDSDMTRSVSDDR